MDLQKKIEVFKNSLIELDSIVSQVEKEVLGNEKSVPLFKNNVNFFTKSFLISACAHLEMCIKEIVLVLADNIDDRLTAAAVPASIFDWRYSTKKKSEQTNSQLISCKIGMTKKEVDDLVSGNVFKTRDALSIVGIELDSNKAAWEGWKDAIQAIVTRRNNIVHHNDSASDISFGDIRAHIKSILEYIDFIVEACKYKN